MIFNCSINFHSFSAVAHVNSWVYMPFQTLRFHLFKKKYCAFSKDFSICVPISRTKKKKNEKHKEKTQNIDCNESTLFLNTNLLTNQIKIEPNCILTWPNLWYKRKSSADCATSSAFQLMNYSMNRMKMSVKIEFQNRLNRPLNKDGNYLITLVLNESTTDAALPVQLIKINPKQRAGCANPKRASVFAPAPSPKPMTYFTCKKSNTVTKSSPSVFNDGKTKLCQSKKQLQVFKIYQTYDKLPSNDLRIGKFVSVISMTGNIDVNEAWTLFYFHHAWTVHKLLERCI